MSVRRLFGTATADAGVFWSDKVSEQGWRIQYNKTLDKVSPLKPYRLLDPSGNLWASSDTMQEMVDDLPGLIDEFSGKDSLFSSEEAKKLAKEAIGILVTAGQVWLAKEVSEE
ncbi:hypothetical protein A3754_06405 [Alcanivorax sp. HI0083]|uniref:hypothetical protein n=1 Tax=unclassified Alcanivorax TaxID=2638842 RepID=UPI0007B92E89|nr:MULTISPECIES: hypothetical protein [unclassified Alcanivorax]KZY28191.1 hypothetical protein A3730_22530 [Alcanivorax sp. HI0044]KZY36744.1 hypothetical protein A3730_12605 [Alcanivorax sp. HI0044]KZZ28349.1 hypothetical protein A3754_06405 [Alcanivorax sp. HI0083]